MREIQVERQSLDRGVRVLVGGEIDLYSGEQLQRELMQACGQGEDYIEVDLHQVSYMDSSGVSILVRAWKALNGSGGSLRLTRVPGMLLTTIRVVGLGFLLD